MAFFLSGSSAPPSSVLLYLVISCSELLHPLFFSAGHCPCRLFSSISRSLFSALLFFSNALHLSSAGPPWYSAVLELTAPFVLRFVSAVHVGNWVRVSLDFCRANFSPHSSIFDCSILRYSSCRRCSRSIHFGFCLMTCACRTVYALFEVSVTSAFVLLTISSSSSRQSAFSLCTLGSCSRYASLILRHRSFMDLVMHCSRSNCFGLSGVSFSSIYSSISIAFVRRLSANRFMTAFGHLILVFYLLLGLLSNWIRWCLPRSGLLTAPWSVLTIGDPLGVSAAGNDKALTCK